MSADPTPKHRGDWTVQGLYFCVTCSHKAEGYEHPILLMDNIRYKQSGNSFLMFPLQ